MEEFLNTAYNALDGLKELIETFTAMIENLVNAFKKSYTVDAE